MTSTQIHREEHARVRKINEYGVLREASHPELVALVEIAAGVAGVPMAAIDILTDSEQHQLATVGFDGAVCAREDSLCNLVIDAPTPVVVEDASRDPRFAANPFVTGELAAVRFYGSHQLRTPEGHVIGTLCVFDLEPRTISPAQERSLAGLADRVVDILELHLRSRQLLATVAELEATRTELARSNEHLAAFAGQVGHDLRNPLTSMSMSLALISDHIDTACSGDRDLRFLADRALGGADRMGAMVDGLLDFATLGGVGERVPVDLALCAREVLTDLGPALADASVTLGDLPVVAGEPAQLRAVLQNLIGNAAKFTRPGTPATVRVTSLRVTSGWRIEVADAGRGIPSARRGEVFSELARLDDSVAGTGIGLATCRRVVESHGGRIGLDESAYGGTTAWFELPD